MKREQESCYDLAYLPSKKRIQGDVSYSVALGLLQVNRLTNPVIKDVLHV